MRYLITGGAGFIGSHLTDALVARGDTVLIVDDLSTGSAHNIQHLLEGGAVELVEGSILDEELIDECVAATDACLHMAAAVGVELVLDEPLDSLRRNVRGSEIVLDAVSRHRRKVLVASSSEVYGKNSSGALPETSDRILGPPATVRWAYSMAKAFAEVMANGCYQEHGTEVVVTRFFNTVGPRQTGAYGMVLPRFVAQALDGDDVTVYGDGTQRRCFTHVSDVSEAVLRLVDCETAVGGTFNVGSTNEISIIDLAHRVVARTGSGSNVSLIPFDEAYGHGFEEIGRRKPDLSLISRTVGWAPTLTIDDIIDDVVDHRRQAIGVNEAV